VALLGDTVSLGKAFENRQSADEPAAGAK